MQRREQRRTGRHERREERRTGRTERREQRRDPHDASSRIAVLHRFIWATAIKPGVDQEHHLVEPVTLRAGQDVALRCARRRFGRFHVLIFFGTCIDSLAQNLTPILRGVAVPLDHPGDVPG